MEAVGILCSKTFGAKDYKKMRVTFLTAVFLNYIIFFFALCVYVRCDLLLIAIGMDEEVSQIAHKTIIWQIPALVFMTFNQMLQSYVIGIGVHKPFLY